MENIVSFFRHKKKEQPLAYFRGSTGESPSAERYARENLQYADPEVLKEISEADSSKDREAAMKKFVRQGERIAMSGWDEHKTIARVAGMRSINDAGYLIGGEGQLFISGGSMGFNIEHDNKNRDETVSILQQIDPTIPIRKQ